MTNRFFKKVILAYIILMCTVSSIYPEQLVREIEPGRTLILEMNPNTAFVMVQFLIDKTLLSDLDHFHVRTEYYLNTLGREFATLNTVVNNRPERFIPDSPLNWLEQGVLTVTMSSVDFKNNLQDIIALILNIPVIRNPGASEIVISRNYISADSLFYSAEVYQAILEQFLSSPEWDKNGTLADSIFSNTHIYIYGNFNPIDILARTSRKLNDVNQDLAGNSKSEVEEQVKCMVRLDSLNYVFDFDCGAISIQKLIAIEALVQRLKLKLCDPTENYSLQTFLPWSRDRLHFICQLSFTDEAAKQGFNPAETQKWISGDSLFSLREWYFDAYVDRLQMLQNDIRERMLYRQLSWLYLSDSDAMFRVFTYKNFPDHGILEFMQQFINAWQRVLKTDT